MPEHGAEILWGVAEEVPHAEIAAEVGISKTQISGRLFRMRARFRAKLVALGMLTVALLLLFALSRPANKDAAPAPHTPRTRRRWLAARPGGMAAHQLLQIRATPVKRNRAIPD